MKLLKLHIENFGKLQNYDLELREGLQTLCYENGWGKSTLAVFIKAMLFGLPATTKRSLDENERKKYTPWQGGAYGGSLDFVSAKGRFRIERFFGSKESADTFALYDLSTNRASDAYTASVGCELFGINADGFERSVYLSQAIYDLKGGNEEISARLGNLLDDVDDIGSIEVARELLEHRKKHYVTTGSRGAVAKLEEEIAAADRELEALRRKEEAKDAQNAELSQLREQLAALSAALSATRQQLQKAGLAREQNALLERKNSMLTELSRLSGEKTRLRDYFNGFPPSAQELEHHVGLFEQIKAARIRLGAIPKEPSEPQTRARLSSAYPAGIPARADLEEAMEEQEELRRVDARLELLKNITKDSTAGGKFEKGLPERALIIKNQAGLKKAALSAKERESLQREKEQTPKSSPLTLVGLLVLLCGIGILAVSFLPAVTALRGVFRIVAGAFAVIGMALLCVGVTKTRKLVSRLSALQERIEALSNEERSLMGEVRKLLSVYSMPLEDPVASLTELSVLSEQCRERQSNQRSILAETRGLESRRRVLLEKLAGFVSRYFAQPPAVGDYRAALERLSRDADLWERLEAEERKRRYDIAAEEAALRELQGQLNPFLRRYDPKGAMQPGDILETMGQKREEYNRVCRELTRRENELKAFLREKNLADIDSSAPEKMEELHAAETRIQGQMSALEKKKVALKDSISRINEETDRIPEVEANLVRLKEQYAAANANYKTITHTLHYLEAAEDALSTRYLGAMQESFYKYLTMLMGKDAPEALMDNRFDVRLRGGGQARTMESFSRGWRDAVQFCIRLSLSDALFAEGETPFLLLDDPFVNLDDSRFAAARKMVDLLAEKHQILYLVCRKDAK